MEKKEEEIKINKVTSIGGDAILTNGNLEGVNTIRRRVTEEAIRELKSWICKYDAKISLYEQGRYSIAIEVEIMKAKCSFDIVAGFGDEITSENIDDFIIKKD